MKLEIEFLSSSLFEWEQAYRKSEAVYKKMLDWLKANRTPDFHDITTVEDEEWLEMYEDWKQLIKETTDAESPLQNDAMISLKKQVKALAPDRSISRAIKPLTDNE